MSDDEFYKSLYGPTGKPPDPAKEPPGKAEQFVTGFGQGLANPIEAPLKWAGRPDLIPGFAKDLEERNKQGGFWGGAGEVLGTGLGAAAEGMGAAALLPEGIGAGIAALPWAVRAALGIGGGSLSGLAARYPETRGEMFTQAALGGVAGGAGSLARGLTAGEGAAAARGAAARGGPGVNPDLLTRARDAAGAALRAENMLKMAQYALVRETNPATRRFLEDRVASLSEIAGEARATADAAKEAASRRPYGFYQSFHEHYPSIAQALLHPWSSLRHLAGQAALRAPPGAVGGMSGVMAKDQ